MNLLLPRQIGPIRVMERLGEGGMAVVHRAEDQFKPERTLALKFLKPEIAKDADIVQRFMREGELLTRLRHPHLVEVFGTGQSGSVYYLLMELLPGGSLKACMGEAPARILRRMLGPLEAMAYVHGQSIIHRDLKPSNFLFSSDGHLKVTDFGVCLFENDTANRSTLSQMVVGTLGYMAPEQHGNPKRVDARCDVYAMGAILYEYCTGYAYSQVQLPPSHVRPGFPLALSGLLMRSLSADPSKRTPSIERLLIEIREWLERAEAAAWGEEPLPGYRPEDKEQSTRAMSRMDASPASALDASAERILPYLDALQTGSVGDRRAAAEGLCQSAKAEDEAYLLDLLAATRESTHFALAMALGQVGGPDSLEPLRPLLATPFANKEAAEALSAIALRTGRVAEVLSWLKEEGLGDTKLWASRARLGDEAWAQSLLKQWSLLPMPQKIQALEAAHELPQTLRRQVKDALRDDVRSPNLLKAWANL